MPRSRVFVGVSFLASHLCEFGYDCAAAQSSKINICPHCFVTHIVVTLTLQVKWIFIFRQTAMSLRSRGMANGLSARSAEASRYGSGQTDWDMRCVPEVCYRK